MQYLALYRKYRPQIFSEVVGQDVVTRTLKNAVASGRTSHAYLFSGPRGTGKTSTAKILARAVNCAHPENGEPCGECPACLALGGPAPADIFEFDAASNSRVEQMRDLLDKVMYPPTVGTRRVYILDEVHMLSTAAFNALLKTLEEPPSFAMFILATTEPHRLPATIVSRCQRFDFKRIDPDTIAQRLQDVLADTGADVAPDAVDLIARLSEGGMRDALSLADQVIGMSEGTVTADDVVRITGGANTAFLKRMASLLVEGNLGGALEALDESLSQGADAGMVARDLARYLRDMLICISVEDPVRILKRDEATVSDMRSLGKQAQSGMLTQSLKILLALDGSMRYALSPRVALETALAQIALGGGSDAAAVKALERKIDLLEEKIASGVIAAPTAKTKVSPTEALAAENIPVQKKAAQKKAANAPSGWKGVMDAVKRVRMPLYSALLKAQCREDGDTLVLSFSKDDLIYSKLAQKKDAQDLITKTADEVYGRSMQVKIELFEEDYFDPKQAKLTAQALFGDKLRIE